MTPLNYFFWGHKNSVYRIKPINLDDLRQKILVELQHVTEMLRDAITPFYHRLEYCQIVGGRHFGHRLK